MKTIVGNYDKYKIKSRFRLIRKIENPFRTKYPKFQVYITARSSNHIFLLYLNVYMALYNGLGYNLVYNIQNIILLKFMCNIMLLIIRSRRKIMRVI